MGSYTKTAIISYYDNIAVLSGHFIIFYFQGNFEVNAIIGINYNFDHYIWLCLKNYKITKITRGTPE
jgi:hypothetical protein